jgi:hypothetical protein
MSGLVFLLCNYGYGYIYTTGILVEMLVSMHVS